MFKQLILKQDSIKVDQTSRRYINVYVINVVQSRVPPAVCN